MSTSLDLTVEDLSVRFGGLVAVSSVSLCAPGGRISGLLGPNGAGKTTTFNACTGVVVASSGTVRLGDQRLDRLSTAARAACGLGRTFQRMELFNSMTVMENVSLGLEARLSARRPWSQLFASAGERRQIRVDADQALERCHIAQYANRTVGDMSTGQRRLVELARAIATSFRFLLLDEPSSGLDVNETEEFAAVLRSYVEDSGVGILLVEHDMALVAAVCSYVHVLDFGRLIHSGTIAETLASEVVRAAYLGSETTCSEVGADA